MFLSGEDNRHRAVFLAGWRHLDFDILAQGRQEVDQTPDGERPRAVAGERRDVRLLNAQNLRCLNLGQAAINS
jgi:hypothetical protein